MLRSDRPFRFTAGLLSRQEGAAVSILPPSVLGLLGDEGSQLGDADVGSDMDSDASSSHEYAVNEDAKGGDPLRLVFPSALSYTHHATASSSSPQSMYSSHFGAQSAAEAEDRTTALRLSYLFLEGALMAGAAKVAGPNTERTIRHVRSRLTSVMRGYEGAIVAGGEASQQQQQQLRDGYDSGGDALMTYNPIACGVVGPSDGAPCGSVIHYAVIAKTRPSKARGKSSSKKGARRGGSANAAQQQQSPLPPRPDSGSSRLHSPANRRRAHTADARSSDASSKGARTTAAKKASSALSRTVYYVSLHWTVNPAIFTDDRGEGRCPLLEGLCGEPTEDGGDDDEGGDNSGAGRLVPTAPLGTTRAEAHVAVVRAAEALLPIISRVLVGNDERRPRDKEEATAHSSRGSRPPSSSSADATKPPAPARKGSAPPIRKSPSEEAKAPGGGDKGKKSDRNKKAPQCRTIVCGHGPAGALAVALAVLLAPEPTSSSSSSSAAKAKGEGRRGKLRCGDATGDHRRGSEGGGPLGGGGDGATAADDFYSNTAEPSAAPTLLSGESAAPIDGAAASGAEAAALPTFDAPASLNVFGAGGGAANTIDAEAATMAPPLSSTDDGEQLKSEADVLQQSEEKKAAATGTAQRMKNERQQEEEAAPTTIRICAVVALGSPQIFPTINDKRRALGRIGAYSRTQHRRPRANAAMVCHFALPLDPLIQQPIGYMGGGSGVGMGIIVPGTDFAPFGVSAAADGCTDAEGAAAWGEASTSASASGVADRNGSPFAAVDASADANSRGLAALFEPRLLPCHESDINDAALDEADIAFAMASTGGGGNTTNNNTHASIAGNNNTANNNANANMHSGTALFGDSGFFDEELAMLIRRRKLHDLHLAALEDALAAAAAAREEGRRNAEGERSRQRAKERREQAAGDVKAAQSRLLAVAAGRPLSPAAQSLLSPSDGGASPAHSHLTSPSTTAAQSPADAAVPLEANANNSTAADTNAAASATVATEGGEEAAATNTSVAREPSIAFSDATSAASAGLDNTTAAAVNTGGGGRATTTTTAAAAANANDDSLIVGAKAAADAPDYDATQRLLLPIIHSTEAECAKAATLGAYTVCLLEVAKAAARWMADSAAAAARQRAAAEEEAAAEYASMRATVSGGGARPFSSSGSHMMEQSRSYAAFGASCSYFGGAGGVPPTFGPRGGHHGGGVGVSSVFGAFAAAAATVQQDILFDPITAPTQHALPAAVAPLSTATLAALPPAFRQFLAAPFLLPLQRLYSPSLMALGRLAISYPSTAERVDATSLGAAESAADFYHATAQEALRRDRANRAAERAMRFGGGRSRGGGGAVSRVDSGGVGGSVAEGNAAPAASVSSAGASPPTSSPPTPAPPHSHHHHSPALNVSAKLRGGSAAKAPSRNNTAAVAAASAPALGEEAGDAPLPHRFSPLLSACLLSLLPPSAALIRAAGEDLADAEARRRAQCRSPLPADSPTKGATGNYRSPRGGGGGAAKELGLSSGGGGGGGKGWGAAGGPLLGTVPFTNGVIIEGARTRRAIEASYSENPSAIPLGSLIALIRRAVTLNNEAFEPSRSLKAAVAKGGQRQQQQSAVVANGSSATPPRSGSRAGTGASASGALRVGGEAAGRYHRQPSTNTGASPLGLGTSNSRSPSRGGVGMMGTDNGSRPSTSATAFGGRPSPSRGGVGGGTTRGSARKQKEKEKDSVLGEADETAPFGIAEAGTRAGTTFLQLPYLCLADICSRLPAAPSADVVTEMALQRRALGGSGGGGGYASAAAATSSAAAMRGVLPSAAARAAGEAAARAAAGGALVVNDPLHIPFIDSEALLRWAWGEFCSPQTGPRFIFRLLSLPEVGITYTMPPFAGGAHGGIGSSGGSPPMSPGGSPLSSPRGDGPNSHLFPPSHAMAVFSLPSRTLVVPSAPYHHYHANSGCGYGAAAWAHVESAGPLYAAALEAVGIAHLQQREVGSPFSSPRPATASSLQPPLPTQRPNYLDLTTDDAGATYAPIVSSAHRLSTDASGRVAPAARAIDAMRSLCLRQERAAAVLEGWKEGRRMRFNPSDEAMERERRQRAASANNNNNNSNTLSSAVGAAAALALPQQLLPQSCPLLLLPSANAMPQPKGRSNSATTTRPPTPTPGAAAGGGRGQRSGLGSATRAVSSFSASPHSSSSSPPLVRLTPDAITALRHLFQRHCTANAAVSPFEPRPGEEGTDSAVRTAASTTSELPTIAPPALDFECVLALAVHVPMAGLFAALPTADAASGAPLEALLCSALALLEADVVAASAAARAASLAALTKGGRSGSAGGGVGGSRPPSGRAAPRGSYGFPSRPSSSAARLLETPAERDRRRAREAEEAAAHNNSNSSLGGAAAPPPIGNPLRYFTFGGELLEDGFVALWERVLQASHALSPLRGGYRSACGPSPDGTAHHQSSLSLAAASAPLRQALRYHGYGEYTLAFESIPLPPQSIAGGLSTEEAATQRRRRAPTPLSNEYANGAGSEAEGGAGHLGASFASASFANANASAIFSASAGSSFFGGADGGGPSATVNNSSSRGGGGGNAPKTRAGAIAAAAEAEAEAFYRANRRLHRHMCLHWAFTPCRCGDRYAERALMARREKAALRRLMERMVMAAVAADAEAASSPHRFGPPPLTAKQGAREEVEEGGGDEVLRHEEDGGSDCDGDAHHSAGDAHDGRAVGNGANEGANRAAERERVVLPPIASSSPSKASFSAAATEDAASTKKKGFAERIMDIRTHTKAFGSRPFSLTPAAYGNSDDEDAKGTADKNAKKANATKKAPRKKTAESPSAAAAASPHAMSSSKKKASGAAGTIPSGVASAAARDNAASLARHRLLAPNTDVATGAFTASRRFRGVYGAAVPRLLNEQQRAYFGLDPIVPLELRALIARFEEEQRRAAADEEARRRREAEERRAMTVGRRGVGGGGNVNNISSHSYSRNTEHSSSRHDAHGVHGEAPSDGSSSFDEADSDDARGPYAYETDDGEENYASGVGYERVDDDTEEESEEDEEAFAARAAEPPSPVFLADFPLAGAGGGGSSPSKRRDTAATGASSVGTPSLGGGYGDTSTIGGTSTAAIGGAGAAAERGARPSFAANYAQACLDAEEEEEEEGNEDEGRDASL